jgi:hypothetical protein
VITSSTHITVNRDVPNCTYLFGLGLITTPDVLASDLEVILRTTHVAGNCLAFGTSKFFGAIFLKVTSFATFATSRVEGA